ncbi:energy transducer TonB family protein [Rhizobium panacihumi]|uniref:energy transducer TonB family protein n=1 Tax=Rhizobium panacihumi TaxID=2008450 RepID=UPI003D790E84
MKRTGFLLVAFFCAATGVMAQNKGARVQQPPANEAEWNAALSTRISRFVRFPKPIEGISGPHTATVSFVVHKDGMVTDVALKESSGVRQVDDNALWAVSRMSPVAPFPPDMTKDMQKITAPIRMMLELPNYTTKDTATGFTFTRPRELEASRNMEPAGTDTLKYVLASTVPDRIPNVQEKPVCEIGFRSWAKDHPRYGWSQEKLNEAAMFDELGESVRAEQEGAGRTIEDRQVIDMKGAKAVEMILANGSGPDAETLVTYNAVADTPTGRITVACVAPREAMMAARPVFEALAQTAQVVR